MHRFGILSKILVSACATSICVGLSAQAQFRVPRLETDGRTYRAAADLDLDGKSELIGFLAGNLVVWRPATDGSYQPWIQLSGVQAADAPVAAIDMTGDNLPEIVVVVPGATMAATALAVYSVVSGPALVQLLTIPIGLQVMSLSAGEVTGDGVADLLVSTVTPLPLPPFSVVSLRWITVTVNGFVVLPAFTLPLGGQNPQTIVPWDSNSDGLTEVIVHEALPNLTIGLRVYNCAGGTFTPGSLLPIASANGSSVVVLDLDADGRKDVALLSVDGSSPAATVATVRQVPSVGWVAGPQSTVYGPGPQSLGWAFGGDIDGDGDGDIAYRADPPTSSSWPNRLSLLRNDGTGRFTMAVAFALGQSGSGGPGLADINADGRTDFIGPGEILAIDDGISGPKYWSQNEVDGILADADGDGDVDRVARSTMTVYSNAGDGGLIFPPISAQIPLPPGATAAACNLVEDLDGDGLYEGIFTVNGGSGTQRVMIARPDGSLQDQGQLLPSTAPVDVSGGLVADVDQDGFLDIVAPAGVLRRIPGGTYQVYASPWAGWTPRAVGDVDGDGRPDVLAAPAAVALAGTMRWYRNLGAGAFASVSVAMTGITVTSLRARDLDGDGDLDVVCIRAPSGSLASGGRVLGIRPWQGAAFGPATEVPVSDFAQHSDVGDVDLDGALDILAFEDGFEVARADILYGTPSGPLTGHRETFATPRSRQLADMDGDGDLDLFGESVVLNRTVDAPVVGTRRQFGFAGGSSLRPSPLRYPTLGLLGPLGQSTSAVLRARGFEGGAPGYLGLSLQQAVPPVAVVPGLVLQIWPIAGVLPLATNGTPGVPGSGVFTAPVAIPPSLAGSHFYLQAAFADASAPAGAVVTNGLEIQIGQ